jgi:serine protease
MEIIAMVNRLGIKGLLAASMGITLSFSAFAAGPQGIATSSNFNVSALEAGARYDGFIVTYRDGSTERVSAAAATQNVSAAMSRAKLGGIATGTGVGPQARTAGVLRVSHVRKLAMGAELMHTSRTLSSTEADALIRQIAADPAVAYVAPDVMRQAVKDIRPDAVTPFTPNDPYFTRQWHLRAPDGTLENDPLLGTTVANKGGSNAAQAWTLADGTGITVAVLDTGITVHPDLDTSLADAGYDFITNAFTSGRTADGRVPGGWDTGDWTTTPTYASCVDATHPARGSSWHGTHVSGTVAELTNNATGMAGVAYNAKVLPVRVLGHCGGRDSDIADAIIWAAGGSVSGIPANTHPAQVINMSLGGPGVCTAGDVYTQAIAKANALGAVVVIAAGNNTVDAANFTPASCRGAVTVAAVGITGKKAYYSNYGTRVNIAAPGGGGFADDASSGKQGLTGFIWQTMNDGKTVPGNPNYDADAGTSMAAPHVSGTVALMQSARLASSQAPMSPADVLTVLKHTAHAPTAIVPGQRIGAGIVDAYAAVTAAVNNDLGSGDTVIPLDNGIAETGLSGSAGDVLQYKIDVPAGVRVLALRTFGGGGDVSLYMKLGEAASATSFDKSSVHANSNNESVSVARPATATYYVSVVGVTDFTSLTVQANYAR